MDLFKQESIYGAQKFVEGVGHHGKFHLEDLKLEENKKKWNVKNQCVF